MAFDGITVAAVADELNKTIVGGHISKIAQPEKDELMITVKNNREMHRLVLSANASLPLVYLNEGNKQSPMQAPNFCMLLRKHIGSGAITDITQPSMERVLIFTIEHLDELGDPATKKLIVEIMGKYSNIIFCDEKGVILDAIKHVSAHMSSVREVLPGRTYFLPGADEKLDPFVLSRQDFYDRVYTQPLPLSKAIYTSITGFSPVMAEELCFRASCDGGRPPEALGDAEKETLFNTFTAFVDRIRQGDFAPNIVYDGKKPVEFAALILRRYQAPYTVCTYDSISEVLRLYYSQRDLANRMLAKSFDLRHIVTSIIERNSKKLGIWARQMKDTEKKDKYRIYGELLHTYGYQASPGDKSLEVFDYHTDATLRIPLDEQQSASENAKRYFDKYNKMKRTAAALTGQIAETEQENDHLASILNSIAISTDEADLAAIKLEMTQAGYIRKKGSGKDRKPKPTRPLHFVSSDGFDIYVGKNNLQNDELSFKFATGNDWWFHAKGQPGSHVIVKCGPDGELPDGTFEEAGRLAAYYSSGRTAPKVEIDYTQKKHLKKPAGAKPGYVIYHTNYSLTIEPDIAGIRRI